MSTYEVTWRAEGTVVLEAEDNTGAVEEALGRVVDLEHADASVTVGYVEQRHVSKVDVDDA